MKLLYFTDNKGASPVLKDIFSLTKSQQGKIERALQPILEFGLGNHLIHTKKLVGTPLWEIRILGKDNIRILYVLEIFNIVLILHVFMKKTQKTSPKDMKIAIKRLKQYQQNRP